MRAAYDAFFFTVLLWRVPVLRVPDLAVAVPLFARADVLRAVVPLRFAPADVLRAGVLLLARVLRAPAAASLGGVLLCTGLLVAVEGLPAIASASSFTM